MANNLLKMTNIHKRFPGVYALQGVDLSLDKGQVLAIVGENGAGKSTLMNVLGGIYHQNDGEIYFEGQKLDLKNSNDAKEIGISIIHQELVLVPYMTVAENIFLNREPLKGRVVDFNKMYQDAQKFIDSFNVNIDAHAILDTLTIADQQLVEIIKAISFNSKVIVMDEPTSSLSGSEIENLFDAIRLLKKRGIGIIYISHRLSELQEIADKIMVLRDGKTVGHFDFEEIEMDEIVQLMVGRKVVNYYSRDFCQSGKVLLEVQDFSSNRVKDVTFKLHAGEILGVSGLVGSGRTEMIHALLGFDRLNSGTIYFEGNNIHFHKPEEAYQHGIAYVPEDRRGEGIFPQKSSQFNLTLNIMQKFISGVKVRATEEDQIFDHYKESLSINLPSRETMIQNLSGGNQQKVVIGRWLATEPKVLILDEPTRGIDVGAKAEIYEIMNELAKQGLGIIMISSDIMEILNMSDRVLVMREGSMSALLEKDEISQENIMKNSLEIR